MAIHVATTTIKRVKSTGNVLNEGYTIADSLNASQEIRVNEDSAIPNTSGFPTVKAYLEAEDASGYTLRHMDQTYIITVSV